MIQQRKKRNSSKINLIISVVFHTVLIGGVFYFAAKEGLLGKKMQQITATLEKQKKPEAEKQKPPEPKIEHKTEEAKADVPQPKAEVAPPAAASVAPTAAPAAVVVPSFGFSDGAIAVDTVSSDPNSMYKALVEHTLKSYWNRPEDMADDSYTADVELTIDKTGYVEDSRWVNGSGNAQWDQTVKDAVSQVKSISRPPPKGFPGKFTVRFDVESAKTDALQFSSR
jgi:TonB family protein